MKQLIFSILAIGGMFAFISCERHEWEDTDGKKNGVKNLYPKKEKENHDKKEGDHSGHDH
ncbi:MAG: hypothetical protein AB8F34_15225 [Akkermansiaceae bacterium]